MGWWTGSRLKAMLYAILGLAMIIVGFGIDSIPTIIISVAVMILGILKTMRNLDKVGKEWEFYTEDSHTYWFERL